jgi:hypothetical protein
MDHVARSTKSMETIWEAERGAAMNRVIFELLKEQCLCDQCHNPKTSAENRLRGEVLLWVAFGIIYIDTYFAVEASIQAIARTVPAISARAQVEDWLAGFAERFTGGFENGAISGLHSIE